MSIKLTRETSITLDNADLCAILTDAMCDSYSAFGKLEVWAIEQNADKDFVVSLQPYAQPDTPA